MMFYVYRHLFHALTPELARASTFTTDTTLSRCSDAAHHPLVEKFKRYAARGHGRTVPAALSVMQKPRC